MLRDVRGGGGGGVGGGGGGGGGRGGGGGGGGHPAGVAFLDRPADGETSVKRRATPGRRRQIRL